MIAHRDVLHIIRKCKDSNDVHTAYKAMRLQHQCNIDYSEEMCCTFVNLALTAKKANWVMKLLLQPNNRLASWISRNALSNLINTLLEQNDIKGIVSALETVRSRGMSHVIDTKVVGKVLEVAERSEAKETMEPAIKALGTFLPK